MLPIPIYATTDVAGSAAVVQGIDDNVVQTVDANDNVHRHPALFTGGSGSFLFRYAHPDGDSHSFRLGARGDIYEPLDSQSDASPDGTLQGNWISAIGIGPRTTLTFTERSLLTAAVASRAADGSLLLSVDPASNQTTYLFTNATVGVIHELSPFWRIRESISATLTDTLQAPPFQLADGLNLDRRGIDGASASVSSAVLHDFSARNTGDITAAYTYGYSPYSFDYTTTPPHLGPPQRNHEVGVDLGLRHDFNGWLVGRSRAGVTIATPPTLDTDRRAIIFPGVGQDLTYTTDRWVVLAGASFSYGSVTPRLGNGPTLNVGLSATGLPLPHGKWRKLVSIAALQGTYARVSLGPNELTSLTALGASAQARYPLFESLGALVGYDVRLSTFGSAKAFVRQLLFVGLSGYWTTDGQQVPIQLLEAPYRTEN